MNIDLNVSLEKMSFGIADNVFPTLFHKERIAMTDSLRVANVFGKRHDNILQSIKNLGCSDEFRLLNFQESYYLNEQNKRQPIYRMTQDGFTLLAMGFTGKKAMQFKEGYIKQFNAMRKWISQRTKLSGNQHLMNDAIKYLQDVTGKTDPHAFSRENNLIYTVALGKSKKKWLRDNDLPKEVEIRSKLTASQLKLIDQLTLENAVYLKMQMNYRERKAHLLETALYAERNQRAE